MSQRRSILKSHQADTSTNSKGRHQANIHSIISTRTSKNKQIGDINSQNTSSAPSKTSKIHSVATKKIEAPVKGNSKYKFSSSSNRRVLYIDNTNYINSPNINYFML